MQIKITNKSPLDWEKLKSLTILRVDKDIKQWKLSYTLVRI